MNMCSVHWCPSADLDHFHRVSSFWWFLSNEATDASVLDFQAGMLLTRQLKEMHETLIDKDILFVQKYLL